MLHRRRATSLPVVRAALGRVRSGWCAWPAALALAGFVGAAVLAGVTLLGPVAGRARAAGPSPVAQRAAHYLEHAQNPDGGLGEAPGESSDQLFAGWAALGLASARVDIASLSTGTGTPTLLQYVDAGAGAHVVGSLERTILVVRAAGASASAVDGHDLVDELVRRFAADGAVQGQVNLTAFGLLALRAADVASTAGLRARAARWLAEQDDRDGGYSFSGRGGDSDADDTGSVLEAFGSDRSAAVVRARRRAVAFLRHDQDGDGGFSDGSGGSNSQSTAWAVQGLIAAGVAPGSLRRDGHTPMGYLQALVGPNGAVRYARGTTQTPVWVTGEVLMALTGTPLPFVSAPSTHTGAQGASTSPSTSPSASPPAGGSAVPRGAGVKRRAAAGAHRSRPTSARGVTRRAASRPRRRVPGSGRRHSGGGAKAAVSRAVHRMEAAVSVLSVDVVAHARVR